MWTWHSVSPRSTHWPCVPRVLGILLLLVAYLNAQNSSWDNPSCTEGVVSVSRGSRAMMACNISNTFSQVTVQLHVHGEVRTLFNKKPQGHFFSDDWELQVQGGQAQLVIAAAQDIHAGQYHWLLNGLQRSFKATTLNVSAEPQDQEEAAGLGPSMLSWDSPSSSEALQARSQAMPQSTVGILVAVLLLILVVSTLGWCWHRRSL